MARGIPHVIRNRFNRAVSHRVDAQMDWRMELLEKSIANLQRVTTEMSTTIADRLTVLEEAALRQNREASRD